jgi:hypothetical protein
MNTQDLYNAMSDALGTAGTNRLQSTVRDYIEDNPHDEPICKAADIAAVISDFKTKQMHEASSGYTDESDHRAFVKKMDNIINDTARICRHQLGYTIVCKKRGNIAKGKAWEYVPAVPKAPAIKVAPPAPVLEPCTQKHYDPAIHMDRPGSFWEGVLQLTREFPSYNYADIYYILDKTPEKLIDLARGMGISPVQMGKAVAAWIRDESGTKEGNDNG